MAFEAGGGSEITVFASGAGGGCVFSIAPMIKNRVPIPIAEMKSDILRPRVSTPKNMKREVATSLTTPIQSDVYTAALKCQAP